RPRRDRHRHHERHGVRDGPDVLRAGRRRGRRSRSLHRHGVGGDVAESAQRRRVIMKRVSGNLVAAAFIGIVFVASPSRADTLFVPWLGANTGNENVSGVIDFGASVGTMVGGVIGVDFDFGYSPDFFGNGLNSHVLTTMGNVTVGIPFDRGHAAGIRPYLTGGIGLIRASIDSPRFGVSVANNDVASTRAAA